MLRARAGFTMAEVIIALVLTAVIGTAVTGVFVAQSQFFDKQEKVGFARGVSRGALNVMMSELRMLHAREPELGIEAATNTKITLRVPYALGVVCGTGGAVVTLSRFPADPAVLADSAYSGYAYRQANGSYAWVPGTAKPVPGLSSACTNNNIRVLTAEGGKVDQLEPTLLIPIGTPIVLIQRITYEFRASTAVPGRVGLYRYMHARLLDEELVAPFDTTAKFRFYVNNGSTAQTAVPGTLSDITGLELILDGVSERPGMDGQFQRVPLKTSVFFRNQ